MIRGREEMIAVTVKYHRNQLARETPYDRLGPIRGVSVRTRRLLVIYIVVALMVSFLVSGRFMEGALEFNGRPVIRGEGVIVGKTVADLSSGKTVHRLDIRIALVDGDGLEASAAVGESEWAGFETGDRIGLMYQLGRSGRRARILQTGTLALGSPIQ